MTDSRLADYCNYAQAAIMRELSSVAADGKPYTTRGIYVGGVDQLTLTVATGQLITLPATHEVILELEIVNSQDINNGWYSDLDLTGLVDPDFAQDVLAIPQGLDGSGNRIYMIPASTVGDTVKVMAKKRFVPVAADGDFLCVPNVEAVADMLKAIYKRERNDNPDDAEKYRLAALRSMAGELNGYLADPTRSQMRKAAYLADERTYAANTLGYIRARIALDLPAMLKVGKTQITRAINRAVERLVQRTNELRTTGRLSVKTGLDLLTYAKANTATDVLVISDYEQIRTMVAGSLNPEAFADAEARAYSLLEAEETNRLEIKRHEDYTTDYNIATPYSRNWYGAKYGLESPNGLRYSNAELRRLIVRATEWIYEKIYEYQLVDRNRVKNTVPVLPVAPVDDAAAYASIVPWEEMKFVLDALSYMGDPVTKTVDPNAQAWQDSALKLIYRRLDAELEKLRYTTYASGLQTFIANAQENTLGYFAYKMALEQPDGLKMSDVEWFRMVNEAVREAIQHRNSLAATELYSNVDGPDILAFTYRQNPADILPYAEFEVVRLLTIAQAVPAQASDLKQQAFELIERNLAMAVKATRNARWHCLLALPRFAFGWMRATVGLGLSERGFSFSDQKVGRMVNDAEDALCRTPNFKNGEGMYTLVSDENGLITLPADAERIIYADICGLPLTVKHRSFEYIPIPSGYGVQPNFFSTLSNWTAIGPFGYRGRAALQDRGFDDNGNRIYYVQGCWVVNFDMVDGSSAGANVNVVVKRKFVPKVADDDVMLVQNVDAIRRRVEAEIARLDGKLGDAGALETSAADALDGQLLNEKAGEMVVPKFTFAGRKGGVRTLYRRRF